MGHCTNPVATHRVGGGRRSPWQCEAMCKFNLWVYDSISLQQMSREMSGLRLKLVRGPSRKRVECRGAQAKVGLPDSHLLPGALLDCPSLARAQRHVLSLPQPATVTLLRCCLYSPAARTQLGRLRDLPAVSPPSPGSCQTSLCSVSAPGDLGQHPPSPGHQRPHS